MGTLGTPLDQSNYRNCNKELQQKYRENYKIMVNSCSGENCKVSDSNSMCAPGSLLMLSLHPASTAFRTKATQETPAA